MITLRTALIALAFSGGAVAAQQTSNAQGAVLRALDKTSGKTVEMTVPAGQIAQLGRLQIVLNECRYPAGNPAGDAYASLEVSETGHQGTVFSGWMFASAPALNAMEHQRYDIWVMRCTIS